MTQILQAPLRRPLATPAQRATLALSAAALFWAGNFIAGRALRGQLDPATLNLLRWALCLLLMLPWVGPRAWRCRAVLRREWRLLVLLGATGIAAFHTLVYQALASTTAVTALLLVSLAPAAILLGAAATGGSRPRRTQWAGCLLSLAGGAVVMANGEPARLLAFTASTGELAMLVAVLAWTVYALALRRRPPELPQDVALAASIVPALALLLPLSLATHGLQWPQLTPPALYALAYIAVFASLLAFLCWSYGVAVLGPERAGQFVHLMPVFGTVLAVLLLGESLAPAQAVGGLLVFMGLALGQRT